MGTNTYANNNEICSKSSSGKTVAAMPDPCFTPPPTPAGVEVVVPYPNTAMASDLDKGSAKVLICNKMAALEEESYMKTSTGDEAAKPSTMQGGVVTKTTKGKAYFTNWSPDVKFEGMGVCRHCDPTTHNHQGTPGHCAPMPFMSSATSGGACSNEIEAIKNECNPDDTQTRADDDENAVNGVIVLNDVCYGMENLPRTKNFSAIMSSNAGYDRKYEYVKADGKVRDSAKGAAAMASTVEHRPCLRALRCSLHKYEDTKNENKKEGTITCCKGQSGHHVVPSAMGDIACLGERNIAPTICVEGCNNTHGTHGMIHRNLARKLKKKPKLPCNEILGIAASSVQSTFSDCKKGCVLAQIKDGKPQCKCDDAKTLDTHPGLKTEVKGKIEKAY